MSKRFFFAIPFVAGAFLAPLALASDAPVELVAFVEQEITETNPRGEVVTKRVEASKVVPGDEVIYTTRYSNGGDADAENVVISNPIPEHMRYQPDSVFGDGATIVFSVDSGASFDAPENLKVIEDDGTVRSATATDYTHVRWVFESAIAPGDEGLVGFRAVLL